MLMPCRPVYSRGNKLPKVYSPAGYKLYRLVYPWELIPCRQEDPEGSIYPVDNTPGSCRCLNNYVNEIWGCHFQTNICRDTRREFRN